jgi:hypothetical protein
MSKPMDMKITLAGGLSSSQEKLVKVLPNAPQIVSLDVS